MQVYRHGSLAEGSYCCSASVWSFIRKQRFSTTRSRNFKVTAVCSVTSINTTWSRAWWRLVVQHFLALFDCVKCFEKKFVPSFFQKKTCVVSFSSGFFPGKPMFVSFFHTKFISKSEQKKNCFAPPLGNLTSAALFFFPIPK